MSRKRSILRHYEPRIHPGRPNHDILDWASEASQRARFETLVRNVPLDGRSLLDVGCGLGDLLGFLKERTVSADYTGADLSEKMLAAARQRRCEGRFLLADVFSDGCPFSPQSFDVVFASGIFNLNLGNNREFLAPAVWKLMDIARLHVVFNLLHRRAACDPDRYAHYSPEEVLPTIARPGWDFNVIDDYLPNDFTVVCTRQNA